MLDGDGAVLGAIAWSYEEPLDDVKDLLHRLIGSVQKQASNAVDTAEARASGVIDSVKSVLKRCH